MGMKTWLDVCSQDVVMTTSVYNEKLRRPPSLPVSFLARHPQSHSAFAGLAFLTWLHACALYYYRLVVFWDRAASIFAGTFIYRRGSRNNRFVRTPKGKSALLYLTLDRNAEADPLVGHHFFFALAEC